jgi:hypothetical protein
MAAPLVHGQSSARTNHDRAEYVVADTLDVASSDAVSQGLRGIGIEGHDRKGHEALRQNMIEPCTVKLRFASMNCGKNVSKK